MALTNELFQVEVSKNLGLRTVQYQIANAWAVQNLNSNGDIISQINMTGPNVRIQGESIHLDGKALIDNGIIKNAMIESMLADKITAGTLNAANVNIINLNASKIVGLDANFIKSKIELAFIEWMKGKTISAQNNAMQIDLNNGQINYYTDRAAMRRVLTGYPTQFVKFETGAVVGKGLAGVTVIGSNRGGNEDANNGGFVGIRAWNGPDVDQIDVVGDLVRLTSSPYTSPDGWNVITLPNKLGIDAYNASDRPSSLLSIGDVRLYQNAKTYTSLKNILNQFNTNFKHLVNITGRGDVIRTWDSI
nr:gp58-like family protein [Streptococcus cristatus]